MSDLGVVAFTAGWFAGLLQSNQSPLSVEEVGEAIVEADGAVYTIPITLGSGRHMDIQITARDFT